MADWLRIKAEYISGCGSMRELAEKYGVSGNTMRKRAAAERWNDERTNIAQNRHKKVVQRVVQRASTNEVDRIVRLLCLGDRATAALEHVLLSLEETEKPSAYETKAAIQAVRELQQVYTTAAEDGAGETVPRIILNVPKETK